MELLNATRLVAAYTQGLAPDGRECVVVVAKGTFDLPLDGSEARLAEAQRPLLMADEYLGQPGLSAPRQEMDFAPFKPFCDVLVSGKAHAPGGRPATQVTAGIRVGRVSKAFSVLGPRQWVPGVLGATAGAPQPFLEQDIGYADAFGGTHAMVDRPEYSDAFMANPAGRGWFPKSAGAADIVGLPMPNTEALGQPIDDPHGCFTPMALGPIGRHWQPRIGFAGTYDDAWLADCFPFLPPDFDSRYYQAAPPDQQTEHLRGGEEVLLLNLTKQERASFQVPRLEVPVTFFLKKNQHERRNAVIDTLVIDTAAHTIEVTWRTSRVLSKDMFEIPQILVGDMPRAWWRARQLGKDYYASLDALCRAKRQREDALQ